MPAISIAIVFILALLVGDHNATLGMWVAIIGLGVTVHIFKHSKHEWIDKFYTGVFGFIVIAGGAGLVLGLIGNAIH